MANPRLEALKRLLSTIDSPEKATALKGADRSNYLNALDDVYGPKSSRMAEMGYSPETLYHGSPVGNISQFREGKEGLFGSGAYFTDNPEIASSYAQKMSPEKMTQLQKQADRLDPWTQQPTSNVKYGETVYPVHIAPGKTMNMDDIADPEMWKKSGFNDLIIGPNDTNASIYKQIQENLELDGISADEAASMTSNIFNDMGVDTIKHQGGNRVGKNEILHNVSIQNDPSKVRSVNANFDPRFKDSGNIMSLNAPKMGAFEKILNTLDMPGRATRAATNALLEGNDPLAEAKSQLGTEAQAASGFDIASKVGNKYGIENPYALTAIATAADVLDPSMFIPGGVIKGPLSKMAGKASSMFKIGDISFPAKSTAEAKKIADQLKKQGKVNPTTTLVKDTEPVSRDLGKINFIDDRAKAVDVTEKFPALKSSFKAKSELK